ncbi:MAG TPA: DNA polymerase subunit beta, partial [Methanoregulaceae archaeon]|nr:DNA polymerase subunit beta [Methanoregulaceae archaeon]
MKKPLRLRDFIEDPDGRLYAVAAYDNRERAGCILRYLPDPSGERVDQEGKRYHKLEFEEAFAYILREKPEYADSIQRIPVEDIRKVLKPEDEIGAIARRNTRVARLVSIFDLPEKTYGCTGSLLVGLENDRSDIDLVVYGRMFFTARELLRFAIKKGRIDPISDDMWENIYRKRNPELSLDDFLIHEKRKWNRGQIENVYFDILFTRSYKALHSLPITKGPSCGVVTIKATVTDASLAFDSPAVYLIDHEEVSKVLSFSHTYSGQAIAGELI